MILRIAPGGSFSLAASHVVELGLLHASDRVIFERAREENAVVVNKDDDFITLLEQHGAPPQVVWITCGNVRNAALRRIVLEAWPTTELLHAGEFLVEVGERT